MGWLIWIVLGLVAGIIAKFLMPGRDPGGFFVTILLGIVGALVGGFLAGTVLGVADVTGLNLESIIVAIVGAVILIAIVRAFTSSRGGLRSGGI
jgi:uncharacterized membrane protein YeaQ/YmgE (transglycosylase-associated protein family)